MKYVVSRSSGWLRRTPLALPGHPHLTKERDGVGGVCLLAVTAFPPLLSATTVPLLTLNACSCPVTLTIYVHSTDAVASRCVHASVTREIPTFSYNCTLLFNVGSPPRSVASVTREIPTFPYNCTLLFNVRSPPRSVLSTISHHTTHAVPSCVYTPPSPAMPSTSLLFNDFLFIHFYHTGKRQGCAAGGGGHRPFPVGSNRRCVAHRQIGQNPLRVTSGMARGERK